jgi:hypothetical protein
MRLILLAGGAFTLGAGVQTFVFAERTDRVFAWTIASPLTAAMIGSFYWAAAATALLSARRREWANARVGLPGVTAFVVLTTLATLLHLETFHLHETGGPAIAAWVWLVVYLLEPFLLAAAWWQQSRTLGVDPMPRAPLPAWVRLLVGVQAVVALVAGAALFVAPAEVAKVWPWGLTPLAARALAAWLVGYGGVALVAWREGDRERVVPGLAGSVALASFAGISFLRYGEEVAWSRPGAWVVAGVLVIVAVAGAGGLAAGRRES